MRISILFFGCCLPFLLQAQSFKTLTTAKPSAVSAYNEGKTEAERGQTAIAQGYFEKALKEEPRFIDAKLALADTYSQLRDFFKAEKAFEEAIAFDSTYAPLAWFLLAQVEWELDKYGECAAHYDSYLRSSHPSTRLRAAAQRTLASARFADYALKHPVPFQPQSVGDSVNTKWDEYFPSLTADDQLLIFTRRDRGFDENFYLAEQEKGLWKSVSPLTGVNTDDNEGAQAISPDGSWLVFTACNREGDGSQGACDLYWSQLKSTGWTKPVPFSAVVNSPEWDSQPTIGADNKTLIFTSARPGSRGGKDLWVTRRNAGKWSKPENLGAPVNTGGEDFAPFLHPDGQTLYFASDSLPGMGNADLYVSRRQPDGSWGTPQNLGYPINTKGREAMMVVSLDGRRAYFASDRQGGKGGLDIYTFELPVSARPQPVTYAKATVRDASNGNPVVAKVEFSDLATGQVYAGTFTRSDGTFLVCLPAGKDYALNVSKDKYLFYSENFNLAEHASLDKPFLLDVELQPIPEDGKSGPSRKAVALRNVFFETASAALKAESGAELGRLFNLLQQNPELKIQINGHTDNVGVEADNQALSEARARAVYDYLVSKGIAPERLSFKGFGELQPIESNDTPDGRARNRRTEFEIWKG